MWDLYRSMKCPEKADELGIILHVVDNEEEILSTALHCTALHLSSLQASISNISTTTLSAEGASHPVDFKLSCMSVVLRSHGS